MMSPLATLRRELQLVLQRSPQLSLRRQYILEPGRHASDDLEVRVVETDASADDVPGTRVAPQQQRVAQKHDVGPVRIILLRREVASDARRDADRAKVI